jgi:hypothetical protein
VNDAVYHIDLCAQCGCLLIREAPRCLSCGYNATTGQIETGESVPESTVLLPWDGLIDRVAARVARLRAPRQWPHLRARHRPAAGAGQRGA